MVKYLNFRLYKEALKEDHLAVHPNNDPPIEYPWQRRRDPRPAQDPVEHYEEDQHTVNGYNKQKLFYPIYRNQELLNKFRAQITHNLQYQDAYSHEFNVSEVCKHGHTFDPSDNSLVKVAEQVTIYHENIEAMKIVTNFFFFNARKSIF